MFTESTAVTQDSDDIIMLDVDEAEKKEKVTNEKSSSQDIITLDLDVSESKQQTSDCGTSSSSTPKIKVISLEAITRTGTEIKESPSKQAEVDGGKSIQDTKQKSPSPQPGPSGMQNLQKIAQVYGLKEEVK